MTIFAKFSVLHTKNKFINLIYMINALNKIYLLTTTSGCWGTATLAPPCPAAVLAPALLSLCPAATLLPRHLRKPLRPPLLPPILWVPLEREAPLAPLCWEVRLAPPRKGLLLVPLHPEKLFVPLFLIWIFFQNDFINQYLKLNFVQQ